MKPLASAEQLTPAWLTSILKNNGHLSRGRITALQRHTRPPVEPAGPGFDPRNRFEITYSAVAPYHYHQRLLDYGVSGYDWQSCWDDYHLMVIEVLLAPLWVWILEGTNWRHHRWQQLEKAMLAYQDLNCAEFLE